MAKIAFYGGNAEWFRWRIDPIEHIMNGADLNTVACNCTVPWASTVIRRAECRTLIDLSEQAP